jgi:hypothetical protein
MKYSELTKEVEVVRVSLYQCPALPHCGTWLPHIEKKLNWINIGNAALLIDRRCLLVIFMYPSPTNNFQAKFTEKHILELPKNIFSWNFEPSSTSSSMEKIVVG